MVYGHLNNFFYSSLSLRKFTNKTRPVVEHQNIVSHPITAGLVNTQQTADLVTVILAADTVIQTPAPQRVCRVDEFTYLYTVKLRLTVSLC